MLKRAIRRAVFAAQRWLEEEENFGQSESTAEENRFSYRWVNRKLFPEILAEGGRVFRPQYAWGAIQAAQLARNLGIDRVSMIEFGVAGGNGLVSLEAIARRLESMHDVQIDVYGFDTGTGLPKPRDYRDLPNLYCEGAFHIDLEQIRRRLTKARLVLGLIENTIHDFIESKPAPIGFVAVDVDFYSASAQALRVFGASQKILMPRVHCYFDDIMGRSCSDYNGERLAMSEFNDAHESRKISPIYGLKYYLPPKFKDSMWTEKMFMAHIFDHPLYSEFDGLARNRQLALAERETRQLGMKPRAVEPVGATHDSGSQAR